MLPAATQAEILRLAYAEHWALSQIARHLGVQRASVRKVVRRRSVALTRAPARPRTTVLTPFVARTQTLLVQEPTRAAVNVLQILRAEGYRGGISALRALVRRLRPGPTRAAFVPLTFGVAEVAQVDWGEFGDVFRIGRAVHAFVLVLAYSRLLTVVFSFSQTLAAFLRCHEEAWVFVGGCTRDVWYDNAPTVVAERRGRLVRFHPRFLAYAGHHGFRPVACAVGAPQAKGRVEDAIKVPPDALLARPHLPRSRGPERAGAGLARSRRQSARAPRHPKDPEPPRGRGAAAPPAAPRPLRHGRGAERRGAAELPGALRREPLLGALAARGEAAHAAGRCGDGELLVRHPSGGSARPLLAAGDRRGQSRPHRRAPRDEARGVSPLAGAGRGAARAGGAPGLSRSSGPAPARSGRSSSTCCSSPRCTGPTRSRPRSRRASPRPSWGATTWSSGSSSRRRRPWPRRPSR